MIKNIKMIIAGLTLACAMSAQAFDATAKTNNHFVVASGAENLVSKIAEVILKDAYKRVGYTVQFEKLPTRRALARVSEGKYDGETIRVGQIENSYPNFSRVNVPIFEGLMVIYSKTINGPIRAISELKSYRVGIKNGFILIENLTTGMARLKYANIFQAVRLIEQKRVDAILTLRFKKDHRDLESFFIPPDVKRIDQGLPEIKGYHFLHKKNREMGPQLEKILRSMRRSGIIDKIIDEEIVKLGL